MTMESSGSVQVVVPGSADDPFSVNHPANAAASGNGGGTVLGPGTFASVADMPASQPNDATDPDPKLDEPKPLSLTQEQLDAMFTERLGKVQSGWDKRINAMSKQLESEQARVKTIEDGARVQIREAQLNGLPEHERERLRQSWNAEDAQRELDGQRSAVIDYHKAVEGLRLLHEYGQYGLTEEELLACEDIDEMEVLAKDKAIDFFRSGAAAAPEAAKPPAKAPEKAPPAGAAAKQDLGGNPPGGEGPKFLTGQSIESMGANIKTLFGSSGPNVPW